MSLPGADCELEFEGDQTSDEDVPQLTVRVPS